MSEIMKVILAAVGFFYVGIGAIFVISLWEAAKKCNGEEERRRRRAHAARMTLVSPLWVPVVIGASAWDLIKMAELWPRKEKPKLSVEFCPECKKKLRRGPMR